MCCRMTHGISVDSTEPGQTKSVVRPEGSEAERRSFAEGMGRRWPRRQGSQHIGDRKDGAERRHRRPLILRIAATVKLLGAGIHTFTIYGQSVGSGGTWRNNVCPDCEVDVGSHL